MTNKQLSIIRRIIFETLLELIEDTHNYAPDSWEYDFERTIERKLEEHIESL